MNYEKAWYFLKETLQNDKKQGSAHKVLRTLTLIEEIEFDNKEHRK